jgi:hypothetical protein
MNITFEEATQIILQAIKDEIRPDVANEDVAVFSAAYCKIYHPLWAFPERQEFMERLFKYDDFPQSEIPCRYCDSVLFQGATRIEPDINLYWIERAAKYFGDGDTKDWDKTWDDVFNDLKKELEEKASFQIQ